MENIESTEQDHHSDGTTATESGKTGSDLSGAASKSAEQSEFDDLVSRKKTLWLEIKHLDPAIREMTHQQQEINQIDRRMMDLWTTYDIKREEE